MEAEQNRGRRRDLVGLGMDLTLLANDIAELAEREVAPYSGPVVPRQVAEILEARRLRSRMFAIELCNPNWTFLLELFRAHLEGRPLEWTGRVRARDLDRMRALGLVEREGETATLTDYGAGLMHHQFKAEKLALLLLA